MTLSQESIVNFYALLLLFSDKLIFLTVEMEWFILMNNNKAVFTVTIKDKVGFTGNQRWCFLLDI